MRLNPCSISSVRYQVRGEKQERTITERSAVVDKHNT